MATRPFAGVPLREMIEAAEDDDGDGEGISSVADPKNSNFAESSQSAETSFAFVDMLLKLRHWAAPMGD